MIAAAENPLLTAVRDYLRSKLGYSDAECGIEIDETPAAIAPDKYVAVIGNGITEGKHNNFGAGSHDQMHAIRIVVLQKIADVARDRQKNVLVANTTGINAELGRIQAVLGEFGQTVRKNANAILADSAIGGEFLTPLEDTGMDPRPTVIDAGSYDSAMMNAGQAKGHKNFAMKRGINFGRCRYMKLRG